MPVPITVVDAFTSEPFRGNPAAVCLLERPAPEAWMQRVAAELNLSETAFLVREGGPRYGLRWFTPTVEVSLCGHATLASAHWLWETQQAETNLAFSTTSGTLSATRTSEGIELDFPARSADEVSAPDGLLAALGCDALWVGQSAYDYLVVVASEETVRRVTPDVAALRQLQVRGVIVTAPSQAYDFVSRFFAPGAGVDEDPVTGSAHCTLAPFWGQRLGKTTMRGYQASKRGGIVGVRTNGNRVTLIGRAVTIWRGQLLSGPDDERCT